MSVVNTTAAGFTVATFEPIASWAVNGFPHPAPEAVSFALAATLVPIIHVLYLCVAGWIAKRTGVAVPATTTKA